MHMGLQFHQLAQYSHRLQRVTVSALKLANDAALA